MTITSLSKVMWRTATGEKRSALFAFDHPVFVGEAVKIKPYKSSDKVVIGEVISEYIMERKLSKFKF